jgi:hypothetical protein
LNEAITRALSSGEPWVSPPRVIETRRSRWLRTRRERLTTTPDRLIVIATVLTAGALAFALISAAAIRTRAQAAQAARTQTEPLLVQAVRLYTSLADANATAATTFLTGGLEAPTQRTRYVSDLQRASQALATLTRDARSGADTQASSIISQLPRYSGWVEDARANNRNDFPVGAAYLRKAALTLRGTILPAADQLYATEATRLSGDYATGRSIGALLVVGIGAGIGLVLLALTQVYLARLSRRTFNVPLLVATIALAIASVWVVIALINEGNALAAARSKGSDPVEVLSTTQILLSRAQGDQSLTAVNRGSDSTDPVDFKHLMTLVAPPSGLLGEAAVLARQTGDQTGARRLAAEFARYRAATSSGASGQTAGETASNAQFAAGLENVLNTDLAQRVDSAQARFKRYAADATSSISGAEGAIAFFAIITGVLGLIGVRQRLGEYR